MCKEIQKIEKKGKLTPEQLEEKILETFQDEDVPFDVQEKKKEELSPIPTKTD